VLIRWRTVRSLTRTKSIADRTNFWSQRPLPPRWSTIKRGGLRNRLGFSARWRALHRPVRARAGHRYAWVLFSLGAAPRGRKSRPQTAVMYWLARMKRASALRFISRPGRQTSKPLVGSTVSASGLFSEPAAGRLSLALRRLVGRHTPNPIFVRLRFLIFLIAFLTLRHIHPLVESANTSWRRVYF